MGRVLPGDARWTPVRLHPGLRRARRARRRIRRPAAGLLGRGPFHRRGPHDWPRPRFGDAARICRSAIRPGPHVRLDRSGSDEPPRRQRLPQGGFRSRRRTADRFGAGADNATPRSRPTFALIDDIDMIRTLETLNWSLFNSNNLSSARTRTPESTSLSMIARQQDRARARDWSPTEPARKSL